jgi:signal transduction histidine kinase
MQINIHGMPLVYADPNRVRQVLINLISNAVKYSPSGGKVEVSLVMVKEPAEMRVSVRDEGMGIAPEDQERIFMAFFRARQHTDQLIAGLGLGLAVSKALVEAHGGRIWVESTPGVGSTFTFTLPLERLGEGDRVRQVEV